MALFEKEFFAMNPNIIKKEMDFPNIEFLQTKYNFIFPGRYTRYLAKDVIG